MSEKILIKSEQYNVKIVFKVFVIIGIILSVIALVSMIDNASSSYDYDRARYLEHSADGDCGYYWDNDELCFSCREVEGSSKTEYMFSYIFGGFWEFLIYLLPVAAMALIGGLIYLWLRSYELIVTDKRIYGKVAWGKRVDLPVDSVSATSTIRLLKGVSVATSSGRISFRVIKNADEIYNVINDLLIKRQQEKSKPVAAMNDQKVDEADQLKKYKDLLDMGVITQEEFDAKKKQLLGL